MTLDLETIELRVGVVQTLDATNETLRQLVLVDVPALITRIRELEKDLEEMALDHLDTEKALAAADGDRFDVRDQLSQARTDNAVLRRALGDIFALAGQHV